MKNFLIVLFSLIFFFPAGVYVGLTYLVPEDIPVNETTELVTQEDTQETANQIIEGYNLDIANKVILGGAVPVALNEDFVSFLDDKKAVITNFTLPHTADALGQVFIAATFKDEKNESSFFTTEIYRYSLKNGEYVKVFEYFSSNEEAPTQLRPIATDGDILVVQKEQVDNQTGECATVWTVGELMSFSLSDNDRELAPYETPESIQKRNQSVIDRCEFTQGIQE